MYNLLIHLFINEIPYRDLIVILKSIRVIIHINICFISVSFLESRILYIPIWNINFRKIKKKKKQHRSVMVGTSSSSSIICRVSSRLASNPLYTACQNSLPDKQINTRGNGAYILSAMNFAGLRPRGFRLPFLSSLSLSLSPYRWLSRRVAPPSASLFSRPITPTAKKSLRHRAWRSCVLARQTRRPD